MRPNLFIVGAPKCGTTAWVHYLSCHPDVFFSTPKEPHHFNYDMPHYRWYKDRQKYLRLFDDSGSARVVGEASVFYLYSREAARRLREFNPDARIIILIRNQEDFLPSLHNQIVSNGDQIIKDFEQAWRLSEVRDSTNSGLYCRDLRLLNYKAAGRFSEQVERYFGCFPAEQIRVLHFSDWTSAPRDTYLEIMRFLDLPDDGRTDFPPINEARNSRLIWFTRLLRRPPRFIRALRKILWTENIGTRIQQLNSRPGYLSSASDALKDEIRDYFRETNALTEPRIWRPRSHT